MKNPTYKNILQKAPFGYAYHKIILDDKGNPVDYEFLDVNPAFEKLTGLKTGDIINRKVTEAIPGITKEGDFDWIGYYGEIALNGGEKEFEQYSKPLKKWYRVNAYSIEKHYFTTVFTDITQEKFIINASKYFLGIHGEEPDYQKICDDLLAITNAKYIILNIDDDNGKDFTTVAISGIDKHIRKVSEFLGFELAGKKWKHGQVRAERIRHKQITKLKKISDLLDDILPRKTITLIEDFFNLGEIAVIKISKADRVLGDYVVIMPEGETLKNESLVELYVQQTGLFLEKLSTEQKYVEESQLRSQLLDNIPGYLALVLKKGTREIVASNKAAHSAGAVPGKTCFGTSAMRDAPCSFCLADEMWETGEVQNIEVEYRGRWYEGNWAPLSDDLYMHYIKDITETKQAEEALKTNEKFLSDVFDSIQDGISVVDKELNIMRVNNTMKKWYSHKLPLEGKKCYEAYQDRIKACDYCPSLHSLKTGKLESKEVIIKVKDGSDGILEVYSFPLTDEKNNITGVIEYVRDITKRKQAEQALRESEESFRDLYENATIGIYRTTPDGKIITANPALLKMLGYKSFKELAGINLEKEGYETEYSKNEFKEEIKKSGKIIGKEGYWKTKSGDSIYVTENARAVYDDSGKINFYEGFVEDITNRKQTEMLLRARIKLMEFSETLPIEELLKETLKEAELLTKSKVGFYHFYNEEKGEITISQWSERTEKEFCFVKEQYDQHYPLAEAGVWTDCIRKRKAVIHNDYESLTHKKGMPQGHAKIIRELTVPVIRNKKIVAIIGVGNKDVNYQKTDVELLSQLADMIWDIVERKHAENELRASEEKYRLIAEGTSDMVWITDMSFKTTYVSPSVEKILGFSPEQHMQKKIEQKFPPHHLQKLLQEFENEYEKEFDTSSDKNRNKIIEVEHYHANGSLVWVEMNMSFLRDNQGNPIAVHGVTRDISERKKAEETLKTYEKIFFNTNDMLAIIGFDGYFKDANPTWYRNTGWSNKELLSKPFFKFIHQNEKESTINTFKKACKGEKILHFENRFLCADETEKWFLWDFIPYTGENILIGIARDNTRYKTVEKEKEAFNKSLMERVKELTFLNNLTHYFYLTKTPITELFKQIVELMPHAFENPEKTFVKITGNKINRQTNIFKKTEYEISETLKTESYGTINITVHAEFQPEENTQTFFNEKDKLLKTVTELLSNYIQKYEAIEKEKLSHQKFIELFNNVNDIVFTADTYGNLLNVNDEFEKQLGFKIEPGLNIFSFLTPYTADQMKKSMLQKFKNRKKQAFFDVEIVTFNGKLQTCEVRLNIKYKKNKVNEIFGIARDVTELRKNQNLLMRTIIYTEEKEKKRFAEELHDGIGPLLSGINMYIEKIQSQEETSKENKKLLKYCNALVSDTINQIRIISNDLMPKLLDKYGLTKSLNSFIDKISKLEMVNINILGDNIEARDIPHDAALILYRGITELINNTLKHSQAENIDIDITKKHGAIKISYSDDGKGVSTNKTLQSPKSKGLGIKNLISRVKSINGTIHFADAQQQGFLVYIEVPLK